MITRHNLNEIINQISNDDKKCILKSSREYTMIDVSFFNVGISISIGLLSDLPSDYDEKIKSGKVVLLETNEEQEKLK